MPSGRPKKNINETPVKFTLRVDRDLYNALNAYCELNHKTKAKALNTAIALYIGYEKK